VTTAETIVPAGVTGFGLALSDWMMGPPVLLAELLLELVVPPVPALAPPLPPVPDPPPLEVVPLELPLGVA
jgi:hypothetical protein